MLQRNRLLASLEDDDATYLLRHCERVPLIRNRVLHLSGVSIQHVFFVEDGLVCSTAATTEHNNVQAWLVGNEGLVGLPVALGASTSPHKTIVQADGTALRMSAQDLQCAMDTLPSLSGVLLSYAHSVLVQVSQAAACNAQHSVEQRLARWILLAGNHLHRRELPLTHSSIARLLGVRRAGVTKAVGRLESVGAIGLGRGAIEVLDVGKLEEVSCGCSPMLKLAAPRARTILSEAVRQPTLGDVGRLSYSAIS